MAGELGYAHDGGDRGGGRFIIGVGPEMTASRWLLGYSPHLVIGNTLVSDEKKLAFGFRHDVHASYLGAIGLDVGHQVRFAGGHAQNDVRLLVTLDPFSAGIELVRP